MTEYTQELVVKNRYAINTFMHNGRKLMMLENIITGFCDNPIVYADGRIGYDYPEYWPKYFIKVVEKFSKTLNQG